MNQAEKDITIKEESENVEVKDEITKVIDTEKLIAPDNDQGHSGG